MVTAFAIILIVIGLIAMAAPTPFGFVFVALGFALLTAVAPDFVRWLRRRWRWLDRILQQLEKVLPDWLAKHLRKSGENGDDQARADRNMSRDSKTSA